MPDRTQAPEIVNASEFHLHLQPYEAFRLDNNIPVYAVNGGAEDVMMVQFVFYAGNSLENKKLVAASANHLLTNGTLHKTAYQINEYFDFYGAYVNKSCYNETAHITVHTLSRFLPQVLEGIKEILTEAVYPEEELRIFCQNQKQKLEVNLKKNEFLANRLIDSSIYGEDHPYGRFSKPEDFDNLRIEEIRSFYKDFYTKGSCMIFMAGKIPQEAISMTNRLFGSLPLNDKKPFLPEYRFSPESNHVKHLYNSQDEIQGSIRIGRFFISKNDPDFPKAEVLNCILGGYFGSRLMDNIREDKGYTYGISSYIQTHLSGSAWIISTETGTQHLKAAIHEIFQEMALLCKEPVKKDELNRVKNYMIGSVLSDLNGPFSVISRWRNYILSGFDENHFNEAIRTIKEIKAEEIMQIAQKYFDPETFYTITIQ